jgi:hypothetical protein
MTTKEQNRRYWRLGVLLISLALLLWWQFGKFGASPYKNEPVELTQATVNANADVETETVTTNDNPVPEPNETTNITALDQYKEISRYPTSTRRLSKDSHDLLNPGARHERRTRLPTEDADPDKPWQVLFTADRYFVRDEEPLLVSLQLWQGDKAVLPTRVSIQARVADGDSGLRPVTLALKTDGLSKTAVFTPNDHWPDYVGQVQVSSSFAAQGLKLQKGNLGFFFTSASRIPARFTGKISDRLAAGDLLFDVGLDVIKSGLFRIEANLFDADGLPFGWARYEGELFKGEATATLQFYGLLFHDAEARPPYTLRGLRGYRLRQGDIPDREDMQEFAGDYLAKGSYALNRFRSDINDSPRRQRMIQMYEDAERRGVKLTRPAPSGSDG